MEREARNEVLLAMKQIIEAFKIFEKYGCKDIYATDDVICVGLKPEKVSEEDKEFLASCGFLESKFHNDFWLDQ